MCGIFGFVAKGTNRLDPKRLEQIALATQTRGQHAFGFAWVDKHGRLRMFKQQGRISDGLGLLRMASDAQLLVGHCRYATHGSAENNLNNHPHPVDGGWLVHNGVIGNHDRIAQQHGLAPVTECDSEVLGLLIEQLEGNLTERSIAAVRIADAFALSMMAVWRNPQRLVAIRDGNPLHLGEDRRGWYLASLADGLPQAKEVENGTALTFTRRAGKTTPSQRLFEQSPPSNPRLLETPKAKPTTRPRSAGMRPSSRLLADRGCRWE